MPENAKTCSPGSANVPLDQVTVVATCAKLGWPPADVKFKGVHVALLKFEGLSTPSTIIDPGVVNAL